MRRASVLILTPMLLVFGCKRPEVEAFRQQPTPVFVTVNLPEKLADREGLQKEYASALRARLATRVVVVPEGVTPPAKGAELRVTVYELSTGPASGQPSPVEVGLATGVAVGALSAAAGNRGWSVTDGLFWGFWAGIHTAAHRERTRDRLGYLPQAIRAQVFLLQEGNREPLWTASVEPREVVEAMDPLPPGSRDDDGRIREEEARGFARVVVQKLSTDFQWTRRTEQQFYQGPAVAELKKD